MFMSVGTRKLDVGFIIQEEFSLLVHRLHPAVQKLVPDFYILAMILSR